MREVDAPFAQFERDARGTRAEHDPLSSDDFEDVELHAHFERGPRERERATFGHLAEDVVGLPAREPARIGERAPHALYRSVHLPRQANFVAALRSAPARTLHHGSKVSVTALYQALSRAENRLN